MYVGRKWDRRCWKTVKTVSAHGGPRQSAAARHAAHLGASWQWLVAVLVVLLGAHYVLMATALADAHSADRPTLAAPSTQIAHGRVTCSEVPAGTPCLDCMANCPLALGAVPPRPMPKASLLPGIWAALRGEVPAVMPSASTITHRSFVRPMSARRSLLQVFRI
jgi:hypothetical protein